MAKYVLNNNAQTNGDHEVHNATEGCKYMPRSNFSELGEHSSCHSAVAHAKQKNYLWKVNGCYYCCPSCNTG